MVATVDDLIDVIMKDHRKYVKWYAVSFTNRSSLPSDVLSVSMPITK
jgi:hypothetical protein